MKIASLLALLVQLIACDDSSVSSLDSLAEQKPPEIIKTEPEIIDDKAALDFAPLSPVLPPPEQLAPLGINSGGGPPPSLLEPPIIPPTGDELLDGFIYDGPVFSGRCGNLVLSGIEECEDGNTNNNDGCSSICTKEFCGNGFIEKGEECDEGKGRHKEQGPHCDRFCRYEVCGDNKVTSCEQCDDGNNQDCDGCSKDCKLEPHNLASCNCPAPGAL